MVDTVAIVVDTVAIVVATVVTAVATVAIVVDTVAAMVVAILNLIALTLINLLERKVGKIEVMENLLKTQNMKVAGVGEKEECPMIVIPQMRQIRNPFL